MPVDIASAAAAVTAGWTKTQLDRGASVVPRFSTTFEKHLTGQAGQAGGPVRATGDSNTSAAAADTQALAALNGFRNARYGFSAAGGNAGSSGGGALTVDVQLSAQAYFERAYARSDEDIDGAIADYSEALRLDPHAPTPFYCRLLMRSSA